MQFGSAVLNMQRFSRLADQFGEDEATRILREQEITNPNEREFYEQQNALGAGRPARHGGVIGTPLSLQGLYDAGQQNRANSLNAFDANRATAQYQDTRRRNAR